MRPQEISIHNLMQELTQLPPRPDQPGDLAPVLQLTHPQIGCIRMQRQSLQGVHLSSLYWQVGEHALSFEEENPSENINISLQLQGHMHTHYACLPQALDMQAGHHNMILTPEPGGMHRVQAGDALDVFHLSLTPEKLSHYLDATEAQGATLLQKLEKREAFSASPLPLSISPAIRSTIGQLRSCPLQGHTRRLYLEAKVSELLCLLLDAYANFSLPLNQLPKPPQLEKLYALREYLHRHYLQPDLSLNSLCREVGLNEFVLKKGFRQLFGTTVFGYIQRLRMEHARLLLSEGGLTVTEAADALGYANPQHFSTAFKKQWGESPGQVAKPGK